MKSSTTIGPAPTDAELEILKALWELGPSTVRQVLEFLDRDIGYTTVLKLLQIMHGKGLVVRDESQRSHRYAPTQTRDAVEGGILRDLARRLFEGSTQQLVQAALAHEQVDADELEEIEKMIRQARRDRRTAGKDRAR